MLEAGAGREIGGDADLVEILALGDLAVWSDQARQSGGDEVWIFGEHRFESGHFDSQKLDLGIGLSELRQHLARPESGADHLVLEAEQQQDFRAVLAKPDCPLRRLLEGDLGAAVFERQGIGGRTRQRRRCGKADHSEEAASGGD